jgi:hypothetical protein
MLTSLDHQATIRMVIPPHNAAIMAALSTSSLMVKIDRVIPTLIGRATPRVSARFTGIAFRLIPAEVGATSMSPAGIPWDELLAIRSSGEEVSHTGPRPVSGGYTPASHQRETETSLNRGPRAWGLSEIAKG